MTDPKQPPHTKPLGKQLEAQAYQLANFKHNILTTAAIITLFLMLVVAAIFQYLEKDRVHLKCDGCGKTDHTDNLQHVEFHAHPECVEEIMNTLKEQRDE